MVLTGPVEIDAGKIVDEFGHGLSQTLSLHGEGMRDYWLMPRAAICQMASRLSPRRQYILS